MIADFEPTRRNLAHLAAFRERAMPSSNSQRQNDRGVRWRGIAATAMVELLVLFVFAFAVVRYVKWSSDANQAEFMSGQSLPSARPQDSFSVAARHDAATSWQPEQK
jgi:squalene cyclase